jgi:TRAP-type mannitol/chloroaromatic compound transport system permease small subunit
MERIARALDRLIEFASAIFAWFVPLVVAALFLQWPVRQLIGRGHLGLNDAGQVLHATVFLVGVAYAIAVHGHVRLEVFHARFSERGAAWVTLAGHACFVLPWLAILAWYGYDYVRLSLAVWEGFPETWNPGYWTMRIAFSLFVVLTSIASVAQVLHALAVLLRRE